MIHCVHWGGKEQSSMSLFYFTCYNVFLKVLFNILDYISLFSYSILKFIHNLASSKIKFSDSLTACGQVGLYSKVTFNL